MPLDISNPAVRAYQTSYILDQFRKGYAGVSWDNTRLSNDFGRCGIWRNGQWVQLYSGASSDPAFVSDVEAWARSQHDTLKAAAPDRTITFNLTLEKSGRHGDPDAPVRAT